MVDKAICFRPRSFYNTNRCTHIKLFESNAADPLTCLRLVRGPGMRIIRSILNALDSRGSKIDIIFVKVFGHDKLMNTAIDMQVYIHIYRTRILISKN